LDLTHQSFPSSTEKNEEKREKNKRIENKERSAPIMNIPYPHSHSRKDKERQFARFQDILKGYKLLFNLHKP